MFQTLKMEINPFLVLCVFCQGYSEKENINLKKQCSNVGGGYFLMVMAPI